MKKVRIGNDIAIEWSIYRLGEGEILQDKKVEVKILDPKMMPVPFSYEIVENKIIGVFEGRIQKCVGAYTLLLLENCGELHMNTLDECNFVQLVPHSYMEGGKDESSITTEIIELSTDIEIPTNGLDGDSAYDIWIKLGHQGTEEDFIAWLQQPAINGANEAQEQMALFAEKEAVRDDAELERVANEETRQANEQDRIRVENTRENAEARRKENDMVMREHETERMKAEDQRVLAEQKRNINEDSRKSQEATRISNENQRIKNESKRKSVVRTSKLKTEGLVDTYIIVYSDGSFDTFTVTNGENGAQGVPGTQGVGIVSIEKTATAGLVDTYTITFSNGTTSTFEVTNGKDADLNQVYTKAEADALLAGKASATSQMQMNYEEEPVEVDTNLAITLMSAGINNHIHDTNEALATKADKTEVYTKAESDERFANKGTTDNRMQAIEESVHRLDGDLNNKQDKLVSGTNIKTINGESILGSGDITIEGGTKEIHVGTDEPTDGEVLWIDPNERIIEQTTGQATDKVMSQKAVTDALAQKQPNLTAGENITIENNVISSNGALRPLFIAMGATYNATTGYYEMNGLNDLTEEDMCNVYAQIGATPQYNTHWAFWTDSKASGATNIKARTTPTYHNDNPAIYIMPMFAWNQAIESIKFGGTYHGSGTSGSMSSKFYQSIKLKYIYDTIDMTRVLSTITAFYNCTKLEVVYLKNIKVDVSFADSPNLSKESILYMINNEAATSAITITLHPTAYAMAQADSEIQTALSTHTNITIASA